jgi:hypothetical protein
MSVSSNEVSAHGDEHHGVRNVGPGKIALDYVLGAA